MRSTIPLSQIIPFIIPMVVIQLGLQIYSLVNLVKRRRVRFDNKLIWAAVIVILGTVGSIVYLVFRGDEE